MRFHAITVLKMLPTHRNLRMLLISFDCHYRFSYNMVFAEVSLPLRLSLLWDGNTFHTGPNRV
jgi:hypothetical protein